MWDLIRNSETDLETDEMEKIDQTECIKSTDADYIFSVEGINLDVSGKEGSKLLSDVEGIARGIADTVTDLAGEVVSEIMQNPETYSPFLLRK